MLNALTIDTEDYFQVHAFSRVIKFEDWEKYECRIEQNIDRLLNILNRPCSDPYSANPNPVKATFFVLGWIAERYPNLVRRIQKEGHEIACHGYAHQIIYNQTKETFREDIRKSKAILEEIIGGEVIGYRAPNYSITDKSQWAFEVLVEEGFKYDSSIFPIHHDFYGIPNAPRFPFLISFKEGSNSEFSILNLKLVKNSNSQHINQHSTFTTHNSKLSNPNPHSIVEFPISTVRVLGQNLPISGGGYFRLFPYALVKKGLKTINEKENNPFIFYLHPWEIDSDQPRIDGITFKSKFRHYVNLTRTEKKFKKLIDDFQFSTIRGVLEQNSNITALINSLT